jgi:hypothetical protein
MLTGMQSAMKVNYDFALQFIEKLEPTQIQQLAEYILYRCELAVTTTTDKALALQAFRSQTGKGKNLQPSDIFKAEVIASFGDDSEGSERLASSWMDMERTLGRDRLQRFLRTLAELEEKRELTGEIFDMLGAFVDRLKRGGGLHDMARGRLQRIYKAYCVAIGVELAEAQGSQKSLCADDVNSVFAALGYNGVREWEPVATCMVMQYQDNCGLLLQLASQLEKLAAYLTVCATPKARSSRYFKVLQDLSRPGNDDGSAASLQLSNEERAALYLAVSSPDLYGKRYARLVLLRLNMALTRSENPRGAAVTVNDLSSVTIEHVLPQKVEQGSPWLAEFPHPQERAGVTNMLGNLVLLSRKKNAKAGSAGFSEKKRVYLADSDRTTSIYAVTKDVMAYSTWTPATLLKRHKKLVDILCGPRGWNCAAQ